VGGNYIKYAAKSVVTETHREDLDRKNAEEVFNLLSQLKGSALKIAQMMSMDTGLLPKEYVEKFAQAQNSAMALSGPLVLNTFQKYIGKSPYELFDTFNPRAVYAASIGQVHEAWKDGKKLAVKMQYPGVADAIHSDINLVKPLAARLIGVPTKALDYYAEEFEARLIEECDYELELQNGVTTAEACKDLHDIVIPKYYRELSAKKILTMEWIDAQPLLQFMEEETDQLRKNKIGQALVNFVFHQVHTLKRFHADPHPGNFMVTDDLKLVVLDFGCMKSIPDSFYRDYFSLAKPEVQEDDAKLRDILKKLDILRDEDSMEEARLFYDTARVAIDVITRPMKSEEFHFGDDEFTKHLNEKGQEIAANKDFRRPSALRGNKDAIYLHRTFFGMYSILYKLNATVKIDKSFLALI
jgi:predicted unusual protein kinase regulating ubiquinone biosynthesis (AarF/ABC1/UbiB family)